MEGSPYDVLLEQRISKNGFTESVIELRSLLILGENAIPHATLWLHRNARAYNPWHIVSVGTFMDPIADYVSYFDQKGKRVTVSLEDFLKNAAAARCLSAKL
jgi:hypothetical protein